MIERGQLIGGRAVAGRGGTTHVSDPSNGQVVARLGLASPEDVDDAVAAARAALPGSVAALASWAVLRRDVLTHAVLPTDLAYGVDRAVTALALGIAVGVGLVLAWRPPTARRPSPASS